MTTRRRRERMLLSMLIVVMLLLTTAMISTSPVQDNEGKEELDGGDEMVTFTHEFIESSITTASPSGDTLTDSSALFLTGKVTPKENWVVYNVDDAGWGLVSTIDTENQITLKSLRGVVITGITKANPAVVTSAAHGLANSDTCYITAVGGMTQVNDLMFTVANRTANTFELQGIDSSAYGVYTSGGRWDKYLTEGTEDDFDIGEDYQLFDGGVFFGAVTSTDASPATTLTDTGATFTAGDKPAKRGWLVFNLNDSSRGAVTTVNSNTLVTHTALSGGLDNNWDTDDKYIVFGSPYVEDTYMDAGSTTLNYGGSQFVRAGFVGGGDIQRGLYKITLPEDPFPHSNIVIDRIVLKVYAHESVATASPTVAWEFYDINHNYFVPGSQAAAVGTGDTPASATWDTYGKEVPWQAGGAGSDYDTTTDWTGIGAGVVAEIAIPYTGAFAWYDVELTPLVTGKDFTWGSTASLLVKSDAEGSSQKGEAYQSTYDVRFAARLVITCRDAPPEQPIISTRSANDRDNPTYGEIIVEERPSDADLQVYNAAWKLTSPVLYSDDNKRTQPFSDIGKESYPLQDLASFAFLEDTEYFDRFFAEDNNNVGEYGTGGNEVRRFRDGLDTAGADATDIYNVDPGGGYFSGASIDIGNPCYVAALPTTPTNDITETHVWWGDGSEATFPYWYALASADTATTITVASTAGLNVGDDIIAFETSQSSWMGNKIKSLSPTVITVETAFDFHLNITHVLRSRKHIYRESGEKTAFVQIKNADGWLSDKTAVDTNPDPQAVNPTAVIHPSKRTCLVDESIYLDGNSSFTTDLSDTLAWNGAVARWSKTAGPGTATFSDTDAQITGVSFDTAGTYTIQLAIVTTTGADTGTTTIDITVADENYFTYPSPDPERAIMSQLEKQSTPSPVLDTIAGGKGFDLSKKTYGGFTIPLEGIVTRVGDKNKLEGLVDGTYQYMKYNIDGTVRDLYLLRLGITETSGRFIPTTQPASGDADFYTSTTYGIWEWSGLFFFFTGV
jgi:hypothetical protein